MDEQPPSVLVIDDEADMADMLALLLGVRGFSVSTSNAGPEAASLVREQAFDLIICDYLMPDWGGLETIRTLLSIRPELRVVIATGYLSQQVRAAFEAQGIVHFLHKPFTTDELTSTVASALEGAPLA